ncbi:hypothetical protein [Halodesulfovibrio aestuarii]|uniref:hypothetical protein n=1 Tax=Halodesulfovibrio aestuarii TaxID=126333 RepID=UPI00040CA482
MNRSLMSAFVVMVCLLSGCAYMGYHGKSIQTYPDIHAGVRTDKDCLMCHAPQNAVKSGAPETPHPDFTGCLKCHNDTI